MTAMNAERSNTTERLNSPERSNSTEISVVINTNTDEAICSTAIIQLQHDDTHVKASDNLQHLKLDVGIPDIPDDSLLRSLVGKIVSSHDTSVFTFRMMFIEIAQLLNRSLESVVENAELKGKLKTLAKEIVAAPVPSENLISTATSRKRKRPTESPDENMQTRKTRLEEPKPPKVEQTTNLNEAEESIRTTDKEATTKDGAKKRRKRTTAGVEEKEGYTTARASSEAQDTAGKKERYTRVAQDEEESRRKTTKRSKVGSKSGESVRDEGRGQEEPKQSKKRVENQKASRGQKIESPVLQEKIVKLRKYVTDLTLGPTIYKNLPPDSSQYYEELKSRIIKKCEIIGVIPKGDSRLPTSSETSTYKKKRGIEKELEGLDVENILEERPRRRRAVAAPKVAVVTSPSTEEEVSSEDDISDSESEGSGEDSKENKSEDD